MGHIGNEPQVFVLDRNVTSKNFVLRDKAFQLNEVVVRPRVPNTATPPITSNDPFKLDDPIVTPDSIKRAIENLNKKSNKKGFWDTIKDNPILGIGLGVAGAIGIGAVLAQLAKASDEMESKRLATSK